MNFVQKFCFVYGTNQRFLINKNLKYQTKLDIIMSIITIVLICSFIFYYFIELIFHLNSKLFLTEYYEDSGEIDFSNPNYIFMLRVDDKNRVPFIDKSYYDLEANYYKGTYNHSKRDFEYIIKPLKFIRCNETQLKFNTYDYFKKLDISNLYCLEDNKNLIIKGSYPNNEYSYILITIRKCIKNEEKPYCEESNIIESKMDHYYLTTYMTDISIDYNDYYKSVKYVGFDKAISMSGNMYFEANIYFKNVEYKNQGILFTSKKKKQNNYFSFDSIETGIGAKKKSIMGRILIRAARKKIEILRENKSLNEYIISIFTNVKFLILLIRITIHYLQKLFYQEFLLSYFYFGSISNWTKENKIPEFTNKLKMNSSNISKQKIIKDEHSIKIYKHLIPIQKCKVKTNKLTIIPKSPSIKMKKIFKNSIDNLIFTPEHSKTIKKNNDSFVYSKHDINIFKLFLCNKKEQSKKNYLKQLNDKINIHFEVWNYLKIFHDLILIQKYIMTDDYIEYIRNIDKLNFNLITSSYVHKT